MTGSHVQKPLFSCILCRNEALERSKKKGFVGRLCFPGKEHESCRVLWPLKSLVGNAPLDMFLGLLSNEVVVKVGLGVVDEDHPAKVNLEIGTKKKL